MIGGLSFSPDGSRIYMANVDGDVKVFGVDAARKVEIGRAHV